MWWNYWSTPKLQRLRSWSLGIDKSFQHTLYNGCDYVSMLGSKLNHVSKKGYWCNHQILTIHTVHHYMMTNFQIPQLKLNIVILILEPSDSLVKFCHILITQSVMILIVLVYKVTFLLKYVINFGMCFLTDTTSFGMQCILSNIAMLVHMPICQVDVSNSHNLHIFCLNIKWTDVKCNFQHRVID